MRESVSGGDFNQLGGGGRGGGEVGEIWYTG
jgi:hypothetical protein